MRTHVFGILKKSIPVLISAAFLSWLFWQIPLAALCKETAQLRWDLLAPATAAMVIGLYLWDGVCLQQLYSLPQAKLTYWQYLQARGLSYLGSVVNYEMGQGILAWRISKLQNTGLVSALSRTVLLAYHDLVVLFSLGLIGSCLSASASASKPRNACGVALVILFVVGITPRFVPASQRERLTQSRWLAWWTDWTWGRSLRLVCWRIIYYLVLVVYAASAFAIGGIAVGAADVVSTIPLVLLADALPSVSGLGTRDAALQILLDTDRRQTLLALSLTWSIGMMIGRVTIGLVHLWLPNSAPRHSLHPQEAR